MVGDNKTEKKKNTHYLTMMIGIKNRYNGKCNPRDCPAPGDVSPEPYGCDDDEGKGYKTVRKKRVCDEYYYYY